jgi:Recombination directionality factor-like
MITRAVPKKMTELGRLRIGDREPNSNGKGFHPHKLGAFRLTSSNRSLLGFAATLYGGAVQEWAGDGAPKDEHGRATQYELYTESNSLDILIPTMSAVTLNYEIWSAAGCTRRCTGELVTHCPGEEARIGTPCFCPEDDLERAKLAQTGKACARILRLNVMLPDLPGLGTWRLETKGFYATAELQGTLDMLQHGGGEHAIIEAVLRLEQRTIKRAGGQAGQAQTMKFVVPVLWPKWTPRQLLAGMANALVLPAPEPPRQALSQAVADLYGDAGTELEEKINALLAEQGLTASAIADYWGKMRQKYPDVREPCTLAMLYDQLQAAVAEKQRGGHQDASKTAEDAPQSTNAPKEVVGEQDKRRGHRDAPSAPQGIWREQLASLAADLRARLDEGQINGGLAHRTKDATQKAERLARDPEATDDDGWSALKGLQGLAAEIAGQTSLL